MALLPTSATHLPFGPWDGSAWFEKLKASALDFVTTSPRGGPLFDALYPAICNDRGGQATGSPEQRRQDLQKLSTQETFKAKGEKVANKRWFSWLKSADWHVESWHTGLYIHLATAMHLGLYKTAAQTPWFKQGEHTKGEDEPEEGAGDEDEEAAARGHTDLQMPIDPLLEE